jgi:putative ABC transport system permease protein
MGWWSRVSNVFRGERVNREIDEELQEHLHDAVADGRELAEARRALGGVLLLREESREIRMAAWLDSVRADVVFGVRQLLKNRVASAAAILSLGLAIGACTSTFRLVDALLLRPLPVADAERLSFLAVEYLDPNGKSQTGDSFDYPLFRQLRAAVQDQAQLMAISYANRVDVTYGADADMEKASRQYISGWAMGTFGLKPALGRLLTAADDEQPGAHPYAVISHDYWTRRFGQDPKVIGRRFRSDAQVYQIVGVLEAGFTGTETGTLTDLYVPTMMNAQAVTNPSWGWFRIWVQPKAGMDVQPMREKMQAVFRAVRQEKAKGWSTSTPRERIEQYVNAGLAMQPAAAGVSGMQKTYRRSMNVLAVLVGLVLLIACANVANLMTAQAAARAREMALRISIGAGRGRLMQLVLVESALIALAASAMGALFAWWSAPLVVSMISSPENPARLVLPADWRVTGFGIGLALAVAILFGMAPALRASSVKPASALKGGEDPHRRRRLMNVLVSAQVAFCFLVHFVAGLFVSSFDRLSTQSTGFSPERLLVIEAVAAGKQPISSWDQVVDRLRAMPGVESAALCGWALMSGNGWSDTVLVNGQPNGTLEPYFLGVSPGWMETMKIRLLGGRDFTPEDTDPQVAMVNEAFARRYFDGQNPVGKSFERPHGRNARDSVRIVGYVENALYRTMREPMTPTIYVPNRRKDEAKSVADWGTFMVRTQSADPLALAGLLRRAVPEARSEFRVTNVTTQAELVKGQTIRERMLAMLSMFFAVVALLLAGVGLYGVLDYSVLQRRREIGIRMALGARADDIAWRVTAEVFGMLACGAVAGLALGMASERFVESLLFGVKATDWGMMVWPVATILAVALLAALPPVLRAVQVDPSAMLRAE